MGTILTMPRNEAIPWTMETLALFFLVSTVAAAPYSEKGDSKNETYTEHGKLLLLISLSRRQRALHRRRVARGSDFVVVVTLSFIARLTFDRVFVFCFESTPIPGTLS